MLYQKHLWYNTGTPGFGFARSDASIPKIYMLDHGWWGYNTGSPADLNLFLSLFHMIHANYIHLTIQTLPDIKIKS